MAEDNVKAQMRKGILEYCILAILSREDSYAPKIIAELKQAEMIVVEGTLYPILTRQKNAGLLTAGRNPRRVRPASTTRSRTKAANTSQRSTKPGMNSSDRSNSSVTEKTIKPPKKIKP